MSNGIDFVIGGKDRASAPMASTEKSLKRLEVGTQRLQKASQALMATMAPLLAALAGIKIAQFASGQVKGAAEAADTLAESTKKLTNALQARNESLAQSDELRAVAKSLEVLTGINDTVTLGLMHQATALGVQTDRLDDAAKAAIGLAEATGKDLSAALSDVTAALQGNFEAFYGINPQIQFMRTNEEKLAAVLQMAEQGLLSKSKSLFTAAGMSERATTAVTSLKESIGRLLEPIRVLISTGIEQWARSLNDLLVPAVDWMNVKLQEIGSVMEWVGTKVIQGVNVWITAFTAAEVAVTNLGTVLEIMKSQAELYMIQVSESVKHTFTEVIPPYLKWFGENFTNLMRDAFNGVIAIVQNAGKIIGDMSIQMFQFIASGGSGGISKLMENLGRTASRSLTEGFQSSLTALPEIAARNLTEREKELTERIGQMGEALGESFAEKLEGRLLGVKDLLANLIKGMTGSAGKTIDLKMRPNAITQGVQATEGRLLTRGPASQVPQMLDSIHRTLRDISQANIRTANATEEINKKPVFAPEDELVLVAVK